MRFSTLAAWLDWQAGLNPREIDLGLDRVAAVWDRLGAPPLNAAVITVAGTNGKGSSVAFAEAILRAAGYRCGCYSSPHLLTYNERIRVDGRLADDRSICAAFERIDQARGDTALTYFEFGTLAALLLFADARLDAVVLEVGLGGRLDAVNLMDPDVALITNIALDHQAWLGDDIESIGFEKAGILRAGRPAVFSGRAIPDSIRSRAAELGVNLRVSGEDYRIERKADQWALIADGSRRRSLPMPGMRGAIQIDNAAGAIMALDCIADRLPIEQAAVRAGLIEARVAGRFEVRPGQPTWVLDVAHNPQAAGVLAAMLGDYFVRGSTIAVCGMLDDKDAAGVAEVLKPRFDSWHLVDLSSQPRGLGAGQLAERMATVLDPDKIQLDHSVDAALAHVADTCGPDDLIVVFGSFLTVGAAMQWLDGNATKASA